MPTVNDLKAELIAKGIPFPEDAKKKDLKELLASPPLVGSGPEGDADTPSTEPVDGSTIDYAGEQVILPEDSARGARKYTKPHKSLGYVSLAECNKSQQDIAKGLEEERIKRVVAQARAIVEAADGE